MELGENTLCLDSGPAEMKPPLHPFGQECKCRGFVVASKVSHSAKCFHFTNKKLGEKTQVLTTDQMVLTRWQGAGGASVAWGAGRGKSIFGTGNKIGFIFLWHYLAGTGSLRLRLTAKY